MPKRKSKISDISLTGSKFRILNEQLYTSSSEEMSKHFKIKPQDFAIYHTGYADQRETWKEDHIDICIKFLLKIIKNRKRINIADCGCGEDSKIYNKLVKYYNSNISFNVLNSKSLINIYGFDFLSETPEFAINLSNLSSLNLSFDICIFNLSLMGTDWPLFLIEGVKCSSRIIYITEVSSRLHSPACEKCQCLNEFAMKVGSFLNYKCVFQSDQVSKGFFSVVVFERKKDESLYENIEKKEEVIQDISRLLKPCLYKRR